MALTSLVEWPTSDIFKALLLTADAPISRCLEPVVPRDNIVGRRFQRFDQAMTRDCDRFSCFVSHRQPSAKEL